MILLEQLENINSDLDRIEEIQEQSETVLQQMAHPLTYHFSTKYEWAKRKKTQLIREKLELVKVLRMLS